MTTDQSKQPEFATTPDANRMTFAHWCREIGWRHLVGVLALVFAAIQFRATRALEDIN